jgi:FkbM family methyltransferase
VRTIDIIGGLLKAPSPFSPVKRIIRFFYWQLFRKRTGRLFSFRLPDGALMHLEKGEHGASGYYYYGYPDYEEMMFLKRYLKKDELFVDIGANSGGCSLTAFGLGANVMAIEPVSSSFKRLVNNFLVNKSEKLIAYQCGIGDKEGKLAFSSDLDTGNKIIDPQNYTGQFETIKIETMDGLIKDRDPVIIKIDVEGFELEAIAGAQQTIEKESLKALIIETFRYANYNEEKQMEMERILAAHHFVPVRYMVHNNTFTRLGENECGQNTIYLNLKYLNP